jgi:hypothetical protein
MNILSSRQNPQQSEHKFRVVYSRVLQKRTWTWISHNALFVTIWIEEKVALVVGGVVWMFCDEKTECVQSKSEIPILVRDWNPIIFKPQHTYKISQKSHKLSCFCCYNYCHLRILRKKWQTSWIEETPFVLHHSTLLNSNSEKPSTRSLEYRKNSSLDEGECLQSINSQSLIASVVTEKRNCFLWSKRFKVKNEIREFKFKAKQKQFIIWIQLEE